MVFVGRRFSMNSRRIWRHTVRCSACAKPSPDRWFQCCALAHGCRRRRESKRTCLPPFDGWTSGVGQVPSRRLYGSSFALFAALMLKRIRLRLGASLTSSVGRPPLTDAESCWPRSSPSRRRGRRACETAMACTQAPPRLGKLNWRGSGGSSTTSSSGGDGLIFPPSSAPSRRSPRRSGERRQT